MTWVTTWHSSKPQSHLVVMLPWWQLWHLMRKAQWVHRMGVTVVQNSKGFLGVVWKLRHTCVGISLTQKS